MTFSKQIVTFHDTTIRVWTDGHLINLALFGAGGGGAIEPLRRQEAIALKIALGRAIKAFDKGISIAAVEDDRFPYPVGPDGKEVIL